MFHVIQVATVGLLTALSSALVGDLGGFLLLTAGAGAAVVLGFCCCGALLRALVFDTRR